MRANTLGWTAGISILLLLGACATTPQPNSALESARENVESAAADSLVRREAPVELREAQDRLARAESRWEDRADETEVNHLAYIASRRADIARETAQLNRLEGRVGELRTEREQAQLEARAARAERQARQSRSERDQAEAERLRAEAQREAEAVQRARAQREARDAEERRMLAERRAEELERQSREMEERAERLQQQIAELEARPTERGLVLTLGSDVLFDFDRYELRAGAERTVGRIAEFLNEYEDRQVLVEGFTDSVGSRDYNMGLSERRANAVKIGLVDRGVDPGRIRIRGYGPDYPVASNDSDAGRQLNRRVEVIISDDDDRVPDREAE